MAQQTTITYHDDIDGGKAAETVTFGLDGAHYEIDLGVKNAKALRKAFAEFVEAGRKVRPASSIVSGAARRSSRGTSAAKRSAASRGESGVIRAWAAENGIVISERGRISASVREQYTAAVAAGGANNAE